MVWEWSKPRTHMLTNSRRGENGGSRSGAVCLGRLMVSHCLLTYPISYLSAGDIGGQMGLFIGASILTILELFDYAYEVGLKTLVFHLLFFPTWLLKRLITRACHSFKGSHSVKSWKKKRSWKLRTKSNVTRIKKQIWYKELDLLQSRPEMKECVLVIFHYIRSTVWLSSERLLLLSAARRSDVLIVFVSLVEWCGNIENPSPCF